METLQPTTAPQKIAPATKGAALLRWTSVLLVATVWLSAGLFGLYILAFYATALFNGKLEQWNGVLPGLYTPGSASTGGIGLHFAAGGVILVLGSIQLIEAVRVRYSGFHKWVGRVYVLCSLLAAVGGLVFIFIRGTIGGTIMDIGFGLYGLLMLVCSIQTIRHARAGRIARHRAWALRLYALAIGSWLYRMDYGFWFMLTHAAGHTDDFSGPFDQVMAFFFYLPNLLVAELFIRSGERRLSPALNIGASVILLLMTLFLLTGTYYFTKFYWGPAILGWFSVG